MSGQLKNIIFPNRRSKWIFIALMLLTILTPYLANDLPIIARKDGQVIFPTTQQQIQRLLGQPTSIRTFPKNDIILKPPIPYKAETINLDHIAQSPSVRNHRHFLGTDALGKDVLAILLYGLRYALFIGIGCALISGIIGIIIGLTAGFLGDYSFTVHSVNVKWFVLGGIGITYCLLPTPLPVYIRTLISIGILGLLIIAELKGLGKKIQVPVDSLLMRFLEITEAIPKLLLIFTFAALFAPNNLLDLVLIIGLLSWQEVAKFVRAETMSLREKPFIKIAENAKVPIWKILWRHILPKTLTIAKIQLLMIVASSIASEAALSFLSIGTDPTTMTWGKLMNQGLGNLEHWWVIVFPSLCVVLLVWYFYWIIIGLRPLKNIS